MRNDLLERIGRGPILCDGAMKTQLVELAFRRNLIPDRELSFSTGLWNVEQPDVVEAVHRAYLEAGSELILTNTFKASSFHVLKLGTTERLEDAARESVRWIEAATRLARKACGDRAWVLGDIGHIISHMPEELRGDRDALREECRQQAQTMYDAGADAIIVEYMADPQELAMAVEVAKEVSNRPVFATAVFGGEGSGEDRTYRTHRTDRTSEVAGASVDEVVKAAVDGGADVVGAHCGVLLDLADYLALARQIVASPCRPSHVPVIIQPNGSEKGKHLSGHDARPRTQALAEAVPQFLDCGVQVLGGCCGTDPGDIRAMSCAMMRQGRNGG